MATDGSPLGVATLNRIERVDANEELQIQVHEYWSKIGLEKIKI